MSWKEKFTDGERFMIKGEILRLVHFGKRSLTIRHEISESLDSGTKQTAEKNPQREAEEMEKT